MASNLQAAFGITEANNLFKTKFLQYAEAVFNSSTPLLSQIQKVDTFTGKKLEFPVPFGYQGGVGTGSLPEANVADYQDVTINPKKSYAVTRVEREAIYASMDSEGAFVRAMQETIDKTVEAHVWNASRMLFGSGDGTLGTIDAGGVVDNGSGNYTLTISAATWKEANFEERMFINVETGNTDLFEVESVDPDNTAITVQRSSAGTQVPAATDEIFLQGSEDNDFHGLKEVCDATTGTLYGVSVARRWQSYQYAAASAGINPDLLNKVMINVEKKCGKAPKLLVTSYTQYEKILNQMEDQKRYSLTSMSPRDKKLEGVVSFEGVQFMSSAGPVKLFADKFCEEDRVYALNTDFIKMYRRPKSGWHTDDGTTFLRVADEDTLEARYSTYGNLYIAPTYQGVITGLAT